MGNKQTNFEKLEGAIPALREFELSLNNSEVTPDLLEEFIVSVAKFIEKLVEIGLINKNNFHGTSYYVIKAFIDPTIIDIMNKVRHLLFRLKYKDLDSRARDFVNAAYDLLKQDGVNNIDFANFINPQEA